MCQTNKQGVLRIISYVAVQEVQCLQAICTGGYLGALLDKKHKASKINNVTSLLMLIIKLPMERRYSTWLSCPLRLENNKEDCFIL